MKKIAFLNSLFILCLLSSLYSQNEPLLIKNINYIDVQKGEAKKGDVLIQKGKIEAIGNKLQATSGTTELDGTDKWLIPGLVDAHIHLFQSGGIYTRPDAIDLTAYQDYPTERKWLKENATDLLKRYLKCGITTVIDVGGPLYNFKIRAAHSDPTRFPNLFMTGPLVSTYQPAAFNITDPPIINVDTPEAAKKMVQEQLPYEPDFIKIWYIVLPGKSAEATYDIVAATIEESHKHNLKVAVHATQLITAKLALKAGADILVHSVDEPIDDEFIDLLKKKEVVYIPTLIVHGKYISTFGQTLSFTPEDFSYSNPIPLGSLFDPKHYPKENPLEQYKAFLPQMNRSLAKQDSIRKNNLKRLSEHAITLATGTDAGNIGTLHASSYFEEIDHMKQAGLSNAQILAASTINGAKVLGKEKELGSIELGKMADLLILNANPLENIEAIKNIEQVIKGGHLLRPDSILIESPVNLVQQQLNGYNARDIDAFLEPYSEDVELYNFPNNITGKGKENIRPQYKDMFARIPELHCELVNRIEMGNTVIDHERITGIPNVEVLEAIAVYKIENNKIAKVYFISK